MENEKRLIDADELITTIQGTESEVAKNAPYDPEWFTRMAQRQHEILEIIDKQTIVDAVEVVHGRWEYIPIIDGLGRYRCERCFHCVDAGTDRNYCPNCGAKMDGDGNDI